MSSQKEFLTVQNPIPSSKLGYYSNRLGIFIIRKQSSVIYIGGSSDLCKAVRRLFQKAGALEDLDPRSCTFEIIQVSARSLGDVTRALKGYLKPSRNYKAKGNKKYNTYYQNKAVRVLAAYQAQSRFVEITQEQEVPAGHQSDNAPPLSSKPSNSQSKSKPKST